MNVSMHTSDRSVDGPSSVEFRDTRNAVRQARDMQIPTEPLDDPRASVRATFINALDNAHHRLRVLEESRRQLSASEATDDRFLWYSSALVGVVGGGLVGYGAASAASLMMLHMSNRVLGIIAAGAAVAGGALITPLLQGHMARQARHDQDMLRAGVDSATTRYEAARDIAMRLATAQGTTEHPGVVVTG